MIAATKGVGTRHATPIHGPQRAFGGSQDDGLRLIKIVGTTVSTRMVLPDNRSLQS